MTKGNTRTYSLLPQSFGRASRESASDETSSIDDHELQMVREKPRSSFVKNSPALYISLLINAVLVVAVLDGYFGIERHCWQLQSISSPLSQQLDLTYHETKLNGTMRAQSAYRYDDLPPIPQEVDEAWVRITKTHYAFPASKEDFSDSITSKSYVRLPDFLGGQYPAMIEGFHQLHCLNFLRKSTWFNYPFYQNHEAFGIEFTDGDMMVRTHVNHCIDLLRQVLMCKADMGIIGLRWIEGMSNPVPDFSTRHKCLNYEQMIDWAEANPMVEFPKGFRLAPSPTDHIVDPDQM